MSLSSLPQPELPPLGQLRLISMPQVFPLDRLLLEILILLMVRQLVWKQAKLLQQPLLELLGGLLLLPMSSLSPPVVALSPRVTKSSLQSDYKLAVGQIKSPTQVQMEVNPLRSLPDHRTPVLSQLRL